MQRYLEKQVDITKDENEKHINETIHLDYYLLESKPSDPEEFQGRTAYGIEIVKWVKNQMDETAAFKDLFSSKEEARELLKKLAFNTVTPMAFPDIMEDCLGV